MRGILLKDIFNIRRELICIFLLMSYFMVFAFYAQFDTVSDFGDFELFILFILINGMTILLFPATILSVFNYDERSNWELYERTLPVSAAKNVAEKYLIQISVTLFVVIYCIAFNIILSVNCNYSINMTTIIIPIAVGAVALIQYSFLLPLILKCGIKYNSVILILSMFAALGIAIGIFVLYFNNLFFFENVMSFWIYPIIAIVVIGAVAASMRISVKLYDTKYN